MRAASKDEVRFSALVATLMFVAPSAIIVHRAPASMSTLEAIIKLASIIIGSFAVATLVIIVLIGFLFLLAGSYKFVSEVGAQLGA